MRFGLFCSAQANSNDLGPETGQGFRDYLAKDRADAEAALARQAEYTQRTVAVSRRPDGQAGSHVLAYADRRGETEAHALYGTPDEICQRLGALNRAGADYVLLTIGGGKEQLRRFARDIMPAFSTPRQPGSMAAREPLPI